MKKLSFFFAAALLVSTVTPVTISSVDMKADAIAYGKKMLLGASIGLTLSWVSTFFHELGHAVTNYAFTGKFPHMYVGSSDENKAIIEMPGVTINGLSPLPGGYVSVDPHEMSRFEEIVLYLSGVLSACAVIGASDLLISRLYKDQTPTFRFVMNLLYAKEVANLVPTMKLQTISDGAQAIDELGVSQNTLQKFSKYASIPMQILVMAAFGLKPFITTVKAMIKYGKTE